MPEKALVAMSGGVDSSVAAALMLEKGYQCSGLTLKLFDPKAIDGSKEKPGSGINKARLAALQLGIAHNVLDLTMAFHDKVILPFIETYEKGATPNPCIFCNRYIKFAFHLLNPHISGFDFYATGHYAKVEKAAGRWLLKKASDPAKDQSYVLFSLDQETLARVIFPLGDYTKAAVRQIAKRKGFDYEMIEESQDICFVPDGDYGSFIERFTGMRRPPGDILDLNGKVIGRHNGHVRYTLGQRRGLGTALNQPFYVCGKDAKRNTVTLGPEGSLYSKTLTADQINLIACENLEKPMKVKVKTRYQQMEQTAIVQQTGADEIRVEFNETQRALTPGQAAVLYDGDMVIGGGIIREAH